MVEIDGTVHVTGADGPVPFVDVFQGRDELVVYHSMWYDGAAPGPVRRLHVQPLAHEGFRLPQRPGRFVRRADLGLVGRSGSLRRVHGVHPALVLGPGRGGADPRGRGHFICYLRDGDQVFLTYSTTGRGNEPADGSWACST